MDKRGTRGMAIGLLLSAICLFAFQYLNPSENKESETNNSSDDANITAVELEELQNEVSDWRSKYKELEKKQKSESEQEKTKKSKEQPASFELAVEAGMASKEISDQLEAAKIINDSGDFNNYLEAKGLQTKIRTGTYTMEQNMSYQEISDMLTKQ
ncbi:endolytic transglycosylase MltG [Bacillus sp. SD088]|uniref:endolytic transglycosylase MltG n=1 Tax=Bacillus sp. SD088 TaxID=2782012 RepID=UPI001A97546F|nr:endolytic transglycosylase MltG [Bacillus sp. SD088]MBO0995239.1 endolytic transglycosylase MltG [Bacillus sp. SD088]